MLHTFLLKRTIKALYNNQILSFIIAVLGHVLTCEFNINFNDFTVLSKDSNSINLLIKKSLLIARNKPILNKTVKFFSLELFE